MAATDLPSWARELVALYESGAHSQFIIHGNVHDRLLVAGRERADLGNLGDFLADVLLAPFDVVFEYDLGNGLRVARGEDAFRKWPSRPSDGARLPRQPREAIELLSHFVRFCANVRAMKGELLRVAVVLRSAELVAPHLGGGWNFDLNAVALQIKDWSTDSSLAAHDFASLLVVENVSDLHPLVAANPRAAQIEIPLPDAAEMERALRRLSGDYPVALGEFGEADGIPRAASQLAGATVASVESMLKLRQRRGEPLTRGALGDLKKALVERDCSGLIDFIESDRSLDDYHGQEPIVSWLRQDIALWDRGDLLALPMGYLFCGPVGTGKTYLVECLAGEAGIPVVRLKNFRDRWVGSTESNLEKIFRLLHALGRCIVFVDEADQALGRRSADSGDSGVSGRVYSMIAEEMSRTANRGRIMWVLASSRPDLIEVDLKRPGRVDVKIPIFPAANAADGFLLVRALCRKFTLDLSDADADSLRLKVPELMTAGAAEALAVKAYRISRTENIPAAAAVERALTDYRSPIPRETMQFQIEIAAREATDVAFVPDAFRG